MAILDTPDQAHVAAWLRRFIGDASIRDFILLTGEGLHRLLAASERIGVREAFVQRLAQVRKIARGPKPGRALREIGLASDVVTEVPTTQGVIAILDGLSFASDQVAVQLYGSETNPLLQDYLRRRGLEPVCVAPYVYADDSDEQRVLTLIDTLARGRVDAIAFTSKSQVDRLYAVARRQGMETRLHAALGACLVAAVGPVVAARLEAAGVRAAAMPEGRYFMRPLVDALAIALAGKPFRRGGASVV